MKISSNTEKSYPLEFKEDLTSAEIFENAVKYQMLIRCLVNQARLNYSGDGLTLKNSEYMIEFASCMEPSIFEARLKELLDSKTKLPEDM